MVCDLLAFLILKMNSLCSIEVLLAANRSKSGAAPGHAMPRSPFLEFTRGIERMLRVWNREAEENAAREGEKKQKKSKQLIINRMTPFFPFPNSSLLYCPLVCPPDLEATRGIQILRRCGMLVF